MPKARGIESASSPVESVARDAWALVCMRNLLASPTVSVFFKDLEGRFLFVSAGFVGALGAGRSLEDVIGKTDSDLVSVSQAAASSADEQRVIATGEPMVAKVQRHAVPDRPDVWSSTTKLPLLDERGTVIGTWGISHDVTDQVEAERSLLEKTLTLRSVIDNTPSVVRVKGSDYRYQLVNREFEEVFGVRSEWIIGRRDEDLLPADVIEDVRAKDRLVLEGGEATQEEEAISRDGQERIFLTVRFPLRDEGGTVQAICVTSTDVTERRRQDRRSSERLHCSERIHWALAHDRFVLYGQPIISLASMRVEQAELLIRMRGERDEADLVAPGEFLPAAERFDLIQLIDAWVIDQAVELAAAGHRVEVNLSAKTICDPIEVGRIERTIIQSGAPPANLIFEITETAVAANFDAARIFAVRLRTLGCAFALDDFGVGHGSFTYLRHLPVDYLKIDIQFVRELLTQADDRQVVRAIIGVARQFEIKTIAEGVEDQATLLELRRMGVDYAQGYCIGRPAPLAQLWQSQEDGGAAHAPQAPQTGAR